MSARRAQRGGGGCAHAAARIGIIGQNRGHMIHASAGPCCRRVAASPYRLVSKRHPAANLRRRRSLPTFAAQSPIMPFTASPRNAPTQRHAASPTHNRVANSRDASDQAAPSPRAPRRFSWLASRLALHPALLRPR